MRSTPAVFKIECPKCFSKLEFTIQDTTRDLNRKTITCPDCGEVITVYEDEKWLVEHDYDKTVNSNVGYSISYNDYRSPYVTYSTTTATSDLRAAN